MLVGAKVCDLTEDLLRFVCSLYVGILTSSLMSHVYFRKCQRCMLLLFYDPCPLSNLRKAMRPIGFRGQDVPSQLGIVNVHK